MCGLWAEKGGEKSQGFHPQLIPQPQNLRIVILMNLSVHRSPFFPCPCRVPDSSWSGVVQETSSFPWGLLVEISKDSGLNCSIKGSLLSPFSDTEGQSQVSFPDFSPAGWRREENGHGAI